MSLPWGATDYVKIFDPLDEIFIPIRFTRF